jgi:hypothetical protein
MCVFGVGAILVARGNDADGFIKKCHSLMIKNGLITIPQSRNKRRYSGTTRVYHPIESSKPPERLVWARSQSFGTYIEGMLLIDYKPARANITGVYYVNN